VEETKIIRALVLAEPAVERLFVDFGDEVWKLSDNKSDRWGWGAGEKKYSMTN